MMSRVAGGNSIQSFPGMAQTENPAEPVTAQRVPTGRVASQDLMELRHPRALSHPSAVGRIKVGRRPETRQRLHRLRRELGKIDPPPASPAQARAEIIEAMARAHLAGWAIPALSDDANIRDADGSVQMSLISHSIVFNASGAFRIMDLLPPASLYFEMNGRGGIAFVPPR